MIEPAIIGTRLPPDSERSDAKEDPAPEWLCHITRDSNSNSKRKYELTLEYGPARTGRTLDRESVPLVVNSDSHALYPGDGKAYSAEHDHGDVVIGDDERLVMWDNQARVYYRNRIDGEDWAGAYYIAPISGAVLTKVLEHAVALNKVEPTATMTDETIDDRPSYELLPLVPISVLPSSLELRLEYPRTVTR